jgi:hypothetical protein
MIISEKRLVKNVAAATDRNATIEELYFLCGRAEML